VILRSAVAIGPLASFLVGFFAFKIKTRWCRTCGGPLGCPSAADHLKAGEIRREHLVQSARNEVVVDGTGRL
jgi:hypothetical protein